MVFHRMVVKIKQIFSAIIFAQYFTSSLVLCSGIYILTTMKNDLTDVMSTCGCVGSAVFQMFLYCKSGNDVTIAVKFYLSIDF